MLYMTIDAEMNQPSGNIIQIGYCVGDIFTGNIIESDTIFVNPQEQLTPYIMDLCGITQAQVDGGGTVKEGYLRLLDVATLHSLPTNIITWGCGDHECLRQQSGLANEKWRFGRRYTDVKTIWCAYAQANGLKMAGGLSTTMGKLGLEFAGRKHQAEDDASNTFDVYVELLRRIKSNR
jgi:ATP-dependent DNA helicase DinG